MKICIGSDHRGFALKEKITEWLKSQNHEVEDCGNTKYDPFDDYPDFAKCVAKNIQEFLDSDGKTSGVTGSSLEVRRTKWETGSPEVEEEQPLGILICGSGVGVSVMANRFKGVICALGFDPDQARHARTNDHANVLSIPSDYVDFEKAKAIVEAFLKATPKTEEKYLRRAKKLDE